MSTKQTAQNFWGRVDKGRATNCWDWRGAVTSGGYGNLSWHGKHVQAHRVAYWLTFGGIKLTTQFRLAGKARAYKRFVLHRCDNRRCCNPAHLFLGSMRANQLDAYAKGRKTQPQSTHTNAKLTAKQVRAIRKVYIPGVIRQVDLAAQYGVSQRLISLVVRNETYRDVI